MAAREPFRHIRRGLKSPAHSGSRLKTARAARLAGLSFEPGDLSPGVRVDDSNFRDKIEQIRVFHAVKRYFTSAALIAALAIWIGLSTAVILVVAVFFMPPNTRAVVFMGAGLVLFWIILGGTLMFRLRDAARALVLALPGNWQVKFVVFAALLALTEEVVTVTMTNLAPVFGVPVGAAYITASANYFDVVCLHSVVVFVPMFMGWAWMLKRWDLSPGAVFLLFGLTGFLAEASFAGSPDFAMAPFWIFVYGLMVYLPAYSLPSAREAGTPRGWLYPLAVFLPFVFAIPVAIAVGILHPIKIHFPPIPPNS